MIVKKSLDCGKFVQLWKSSLIGKMFLSYGKISLIVEKILDYGKVPWLWESSLTMKKFHDRGKRTFLTAGKKFD